MAKTFEALERTQSAIQHLDDEHDRLQKQSARYTPLGKGGGIVQNQIKNIASALINLADGEKKTFLVTSTSRDDKTEPLVYDLVSSFAESVSGKSVLLVDNIHLLSVFCKAITSESETSFDISTKYEKTTNINNLTYVPSVDQYDNNFDYSRNLNINEIKQFISLSSEYYDFIFFNNYDWLEFSDFIGFMDKIDHVIMVVESGKTKWEIINHQKNIISKAGGNIAGVILNNRRYYIPNFIYKYL